MVATGCASGTANPVGVDRNGGSVVPTEGLVAAIP